VRLARRLGLAAAACGIVLAGLAPDPPPRSVQHAGEFVVLSADFHVHGLPDGIAPWDAARDARRRRLDVIALTSHNSTRGWWLWTHAPRALVPSDVLVLPGEELTGVGYHLALVGVTEPVAWHQSVRDAAVAAHRQGAAAILAHPAGPLIDRVLTDEAIVTLDGIERAHPGMGDRRVRDAFARIYARALRLKPGISAIGSSDFHVASDLGVCRTYVFAREPTAAGVIEAVRRGRTIACDARGNTYGPAELARVVADRCRVEALSPPAGDTAVARFGTLLAWSGLVALVLAGASET
jgi:predicted metal-dependent phosphoesterase TrpH